MSARTDSSKMPAPVPVPVGRTRKFLDISVTWKSKQFYRPSNFQFPAAAYLIFCILIFPRQSSAWKSRVRRPLSGQAAVISRVPFRRHFGRSWVANIYTEIAIESILFWIYSRFRDLLHAVFVTDVLSITLSSENPLKRWYWRRVH